MRVNAIDKRYFRKRGTCLDEAMIETRKGYLLYRHASFLPFRKHAYNLVSENRWQAEMRDNVQTREGPNMCRPWFGMVEVTEMYPSPKGTDVLQQLPEEG